MSKRYEGDIAVRKLELDLEPIIYSEKTFNWKVDWIEYKLHEAAKPWVLVTDDRVVNAMIITALVILEEIVNYSISNIKKNSDHPAQEKQDMFFAMSSRIESVTWLTPKVKLSLKHKLAYAHFSVSEVIM